MMNYKEMFRNHTSIRQAKSLCGILLIIILCTNLQPTPARAFGGNRQALVSTWRRTREFNDRSLVRDIGFIALRGGGSSKALAESNSEDESSPSQKDDEEEQTEQTDASATAQMMDACAEHVEEAENCDTGDVQYVENLLTSPESSTPLPMPAVVEATTTTVLHHHDVVDLTTSSSTKITKQVEEEEAGEKDEATVDGIADLEVEEVIAKGESLTKEHVADAIERAAELRVRGKKLHDQNKFKKAAKKFAKAADLLFPALGESTGDSSITGTIADEFATCRLHEALCHLKAENYLDAERACTAVLDLQPQQSPLGGALQEGPSVVAPALRARAFHRRAKAQMELGMASEALQDARSAAFLGDSKAVALYGKLMRESSDTMGAPSSLQGSLFESLLNKASGPVPPLGNAGSPIGDIGSMLSSSIFQNLMGVQTPSGLGNGRKNESAGGLAKSVISSLSKRLEDENTQNQICNFLQGTSGPQIQQLAGLAGLQIDGTQATRLASFCQGVTPRTLRRTLRTTKVALYVYQLLRKTTQLVSKYRTIIILMLVAGWIRSAINRPLPISKRMAQLAAKAAASSPAVPM